VAAQFQHLAAVSDILSRVRCSRLDQYTIAWHTAFRNDGRVHLRLGTLPRRLEQIPVMRDSARAYHGFSIALMVKIGGMFGDTQIVRAERHDHIGWYGPVPQLVKLPNNARRAQNLFGHQAHAKRDLSGPAQDE
jgi:hypothetical protein